MNEFKMHELKCETQYFSKVWDREKLFELRFNDRNYKVGDALILREWNYQQSTYTNRKIGCSISYILSEYIPGLSQDWVILSLFNLKNEYEQVYDYELKTKDYGLHNGHDYE